MKRNIACYLLTALLLLGGCAAKQKPQTPKQEDASIIVLSTAPAEAESDAPARYGVYSLDGGEQSEEYGTYDSDTADENALLVQDGAIFRLTKGDINKTGDSVQPLSRGLNAAAAVIDGAALHMDSCTLTSNGLGASGLYCAGTGSSGFLKNTMLSTAGGNSPALVLADGAAAVLSDTRLMNEAADAPLIVCYGDASLSLAVCQLMASAGSKLIEAHGGKLSLTLETQELTGDIALLAENGAPAALSLTLKNGAVFTGAVAANADEAIDITLEAGAVWNLTAEQTIDSLTAPDKDFAGIQSNGFNLYYNAELTANAWLSSQAYVLPGGGFLSPLI